MTRDFFPNTAGREGVPGDWHPYRDPDTFDTQPDRLDIHGFLPSGPTREGLKDLLGQGPIRLINRRNGYTIREAFAY